MCSVLLQLQRRHSLKWLFKVNDIKFFLILMRIGVETLTLCLNKLWCFWVILRSWDLWGFYASLNLRTLWNCYFQSILEIILCLCFISLYFSVCPNTSCQDFSSCLFLLPSHVLLLQCTPSILNMLKSSPPSCWF